jgi:hypothetical protein
MIHLKKSRAIRIVATLALGALLIAAAYATLPATSSAGTAMPGYVEDAPPRVREAYDYAVTHPDHLETVPCYCGCHRAGHTSAVDCFISDRAADDTITYDVHAAGCGICVDIAQDVIAMRAEGKSALEVRQTIDTTYSKIGPGTDTLYPTE